MGALANIGSKLANLFMFGRTAPLDPRRGLGFYAGVPWVPFDQRLSPTEALQVSTVFACVFLISKSIAASPWNVFQIENDTRTKLPDDMLFYLLNQRPNPETTAMRFKVGMIAQAMLWSNAYAEIERDNAGRVIGLWPLLSTRMAPPTRGENGELVYEYSNPDGGQVRLNPADVLHWSGPHTVDGLMGLSVISMAAKTVALAHATETFASSWFSNGANPSGVVQVQGVLKGDDKAALADEITAAMGGARRAGRPFVLDRGMTWNSISANADQAQLLEARQLNKQMMAEFFGVPLHLLADPQGSQGYGANIGALGQSFTRYGLFPWCKDLTEEVNYKCIPYRVAKYTEIDLSRLERGSALEVAQANEIKIRSGCLTPNEAREQDGMNHGGKDLDKFFLQSGMTTVEDVVAPPEPPVANISRFEEPEDGDEDPDDASPPLVAPPPQRPALRNGKALPSNGALANAALRLTLQRTLESHGRRVSARTKDLSASLQGNELTKKLDNAKAEIRSRFVIELAPLYPLCAAAERPLPDPETLAAQVESGVSPNEIAKEHFR